MATINEEPYDVNFCYPVRELESSRVKLTPFIVSNLSIRILLIFVDNCVARSPCRSVLPSH